MEWLFLSHSLSLSLFCLLYVQFPICWLVARSLTKLHVNSSIACEYNEKSKKKKTRINKLANQIIQLQDESVEPTKK